MAPTHRGCALVSVTDHHHRQLLSADHLHHGLLAVLCWSLSFFCGCRQLDYVSLTLSANLELLRFQSGTHPEAGLNPRLIQAASEGILSAAESNSNSASTFANWQFRLLVWGGLLYVVWHVVEMYYRR